jgi:geranylgeranyl pyrophosphate synthase
MGGLIGLNASSADLPPQIVALRDVGRHLGMAFQIVDDILDATSNSATLGKTAGKDAQAGKATFVRLHGLEASQRHAADYTAAARTALASLDGDKAFLDALVDSLVTRVK